MPRAAGKVLAPRLPTRAIQPEIAVQERAGHARLDARGGGSRSVSGEAHSRHKGQTQTLAALGARSRCHSDDAAGAERGRVGHNHMAWMMESLDDLKEAYARTPWSITVARHLLPRPRRQRRRGVLRAERERPRAYRGRPGSGPRAGAYRARRLGSSRHHSRRGRRHVRAGWVP